jgi:hypothetical protein
MQNVSRSMRFGLAAAALLGATPVSATEVLVWDQEEVVELGQRPVEKLDARPARS